MMALWAKGRGIVNPPLTGGEDGGDDGGLEASDTYEGESEKDTREEGD